MAVLRDVSGLIWISVVLCSVCYVCGKTPGLIPWTSDTDGPHHKLCRTIVRSCKGAIRLCRADMRPPRALLEQALWQCVLLYCLPWVFSCGFIGYLVF